MRKRPKMSTKSPGTIGFIFLCENNRNLCLYTLKPMNYEYKKTMISTSWIEELPNETTPPPKKILLHVGWIQETCSQEASLMLPGSLG